MSNRFCRKLGFRLLLPAVLLCLTGLVWAQGSGATLSGSITDPSGAAVTNAAVAAINVATNVTVRTKTNSTGLYVFQSLLPGAYNVKVEAKGFETLLQENITLHAGVHTEISLALKIGSVDQTATVTAAPPSLNLADASLKTVVPTKELTALPTMGQAIFSLLTVTPGVTGTGTLQSSANTGNDVFNSNVAPAINAGGRSTESNFFSMNGSNITATPVGGTANAMPLPDSVAEMNISTNNYDAEYGGSAGMVVNVTTKSGSNDFHGDAYEFHTNNRLSARNIFQTDKSSFPAFRRNEFGGTLGGPVIKNKLFVFGSIDVLRSSGATSQIVQVETPQFANFVESKFPNSKAADLLKNYGPASNLPLTDQQTLAQYYQNNPGYYYPTVASAQALGFDPNMPVVGNAVFTPTGTRNGLQWTTRVDDYFNQQNDHVFFYVNRTTSDAPSEEVRPAFKGDGPSNGLTINLNEVHIFSPDMINEASFGYTRPIGAATQNLGALRIPGISVNGVWGWGGNGGFEFAPGDFVQNSYQWNDMVTMIKGAHTLKFGAGIRKWEDNANFSGIYQRGDVGFNNLVDFSQDQPYSTYWQAVNPATGQPTGQVRGYRGVDSDLFINDNWKASQNLTLNLGVRWDYFGNPTEVNGQQENFVLGSGSTFTQQIANGSAQMVPRLYNSAKIFNFAPRIGFSYNPDFDRKIVIRGGAGMFFDRPENQVYTNNRSNPPLFALPTFGVPTGTPVSYAFCNPTSEYNVNCPINPLASQVHLNSQGGLFVPQNGGSVLIPTELYGTQRDFPIAYSENWNLGIQYAVTSSMVAEADYIGNVGRHFYLGTDVNRIAGDVVTSGPNAGQINRPNANFADIQLSMPVANSNYNGLSLSLRDNLTHGVTFSAVYTWSRSLDYCSSLAQGACAVPDLFNIRNNYGPSDFNATHHFAAYATWNMPSFFQKGGLLDKAVDGWQANTVLTLQSGTSFSVVCTAGFTSGCDYNQDGFNYDRPNVTGTFNSQPSRQQYLTGIFNSSQFTAPAAGQEGTLGRNTFVGPGLADVDFSLNKRFPVTERVTFQLGADAFNLFNRVNLGQVDGSLTDFNFGKVTSVLGNPRSVQIVGKLIF